MASPCKKPGWVAAIILAVCGCGAATLRAQAARPARLTIYNQNFAVVRQQFLLSLRPGVQRVRLTGVTAMLEPGSVILTDAGRHRPLRVLEQIYSANPVSQTRLLRQYAGKVIDFLVSTPHGQTVVRGRIIRAGWTPPASPYGYQAPEPAGLAAPARQPLILVNGRLRFGLPGQPLFPALPPGANLRPVLSWRIASRKTVKIPAQVSYLTGGLSWTARYNVVQPAHGGPIALYGWDKLRNWSGAAFHHAHIQLLAGRVHKNNPNQPRPMAMGLVAGAYSPGGTAVSQQAFDVYHLYTLPRPVTLRSGETRQVEFLRAAGIHMRRYYEYDGMRLQPYQESWSGSMIRANSDYGAQATHQVRVVRSFADTRANHLGLPLPAGRLRFYREDRAGQLQFLGEGHLDNTPAGQTVRALTGAAFDLRGNRTQTQFAINQAAHTLREAFRISLRNQGSRAVNIRVIEHLDRSNNWRIVQSSDLYQKMNSHTVEFRVEAPAHGKKILTYAVHYSW